MNRRTYLGTAGAGATALFAGCLGEASLTTGRPFGEKQHRNNIAMAPTAVRTTDRLELSGQVFRPNAEQFVVVSFWAENLVDSRRHLPVIEEMRLQTDAIDTARPRQLSGSWGERYRGGVVGPGVIRAGAIVFDLPPGSEDPSVEFEIRPAESDFTDTVSWLSE